MALSNLRLHVVGAVRRALGDAAPAADVRALATRLLAGADAGPADLEKRLRKRIADLKDEVADLKKQLADALDDDDDDDPKHDEPDDDDEDPDEQARQGRAAALAGEDSWRRARERRARRAGVTDPGLLAMVRGAADPKARERQDREGMIRGATAGMSEAERAAFDVERANALERRGRAAGGR